MGFTYSLSRLSTIFVSFMIGYMLFVGGTAAVFGLIAFAMAMVVLSIGIWGPRTRKLELEQISQ